MSDQPDPNEPPPGRPLDAARELQWLRRLREVSHRMASENDPRKLLPMVIDAAIELTKAERGFLVRLDPRGPKGPDGRVKIKVEVARGFDQETLAGAAGKISRTVVERVLEKGRGVLTTSEEDADVKEVSSVQARRVLAILAVPLTLRGETRGVLYLDHRFTPDAFSAQDLPVVQAFADQAALALETAELHAKGPAPAPAPEVTPAARPAPGAPRRFGRLTGGSAAMQELYGEIERAARADGLVLVSGESGTGKELVARELHARGPRPDEPFVAAGCTAVPDAQLEADLFGQRRGAGGAPQDRRGLFAQAGRGTLFLDEVGDLSPAMQARLLRVLQEGAVRPVGADHAVPVACRVIASTRKDLRAMVDAGQFREDLFYRLDVLRIAVPPLRLRPDDIPLLLEQFLLSHKKAPGPQGREAAMIEVTDKALELLVGYAWPGNVRELENEARRLASLGEPKLTARHLSAEVSQGKGLARADGTYSGKTLADVEKEMVIAALRESGGNKARAARQLGIPKTTLYHLMARYELS